ncbi:MAG: Ig-like domain-containing protein, partial [bacterium]|nr:Ig-like domain-containing protein [bacterium]
SEVTFVIDLDNPRDDITTMPEGATTNTKYYDVNIKVKDLFTEETHTSIHTIPLDVSLINGLEFAFPGTDKQVNSGCDYASITKVSMISSLDKERTVIASRPFYGQKNVEIDTDVEIFFDLAPTDDFTYTLTDSDGEPVGFAAETEGNKVILTPTNDLKPAKTYKVQAASADNELFTTVFTTREDNEVLISTKQPSGNATDYRIDAVINMMKNSDTAKLISATYDKDSKKLLPGAAVSDKRDGEKSISVTVDPAVSNAVPSSFVVESLTNFKLINSDKPLKGVAPVITKAEFDLASIGVDEDKFTLSGKFDGITSENTVLEGTRLFVALVYDDIDLSTVSNEDFIAGTPYFGEAITTDDSGTFGITVPVDVESGTYKLYVGYNGDTAPYTYEKKIFYFDIEALDSIKDAVNSATTSVELLDRNANILSGVLYDNKDALGLDFDYIANPSYKIEKVGEYVSAKRPADGYSSIADLQTSAREIITLCNLSVASSADKVSIIQNNSEILKLTDIDEYAMFNNLERTGAKEYVAGKIGNHSEIAEFTDDFKNHTILGVIKFVNSHTDVSVLFKKCADVLKTHLLLIKKLQGVTLKQLRI